MGHKTSRGGNSPPGPKLNAQWTRAAQYKTWQGRGKVPAGGAGEAPVAHLLVPARLPGVPARAHEVPAGLTRGAEGTGRGIRGAGRGYGG